MSFKRVCLFLMFEVIVTIPTAIMIYWLLSLHTDNFTGDNMMVYLHGIVMMFAFTYLMAQGITLVRVCPSSRRCAKITHSIFNTLSLLFGIAGLILIVSYKSRNNKSHLYSLHSWCGLLLLFMIIIQFMGGCIVLQSCCKGASLKSRMNYIPNHVAMGTAVLLLAAVCVISGVVNLKEYLGVVRPPDKGLDFENSLLNLMAGSALLVFVIILCIAVSRRSRKAGSSSTDSLEELDEEVVRPHVVINPGRDSFELVPSGAGGKLHYRNGEDPHHRSDRYRNESKSSVKSKNVSDDTAYSDFSSGPGSAHRHSERSLSRSRDVREQDPANQRREPEPQHNRRGSANTGRRNSGHRDGGPHSPPGPLSPPIQQRAPDRETDPASPGRASVASHRSQRDIRHQGEVTSPTVRSPNAREFSRKPSYPASNQGPYPHQPGQRLPSSSSNPRSPAPLLSSQGYPARSGPQHDPSGRSEHSYQIPYREPPPDLPRDMSRDMTRDISRDLPRDMLRDVSRDVSPRGQQLNGHVSELSSPDIPPLFENNVSHLRSSRRGVPPPLDLPPPGQFAAVNVVSPNRYGVQNEDSQRTPLIYSPDHQTPTGYPPNYTDNPQTRTSYPPDYNQQPDPAYSQDNPQSPPYSPQQQTTTFNARPPSRHQVARQHRYEARRAKVEKANQELRRPVTPPASSYTDSLAPARVCSSPLQISSPESIPDGDSSVLSEDVDGPAPRRGRTSYRNAVRDDDPPPVPPPPQKFEMKNRGAVTDDQGICWL